MNGAPAVNLHAGCMLVEDRGVLLLGPSGSGKSTLARAILARCAGEGRFARLVSDDRTLLAAHGRRLCAAVPPSIAGLIELHGLGPTRIAHLPHCVVDLAVRLVPHDEMQRLPEGRTVDVLGIAVRSLNAPMRSAGRSADLVLAALGMPTARRQPADRVPHASI